jgi:hypothetical protein
MPHKIPAIKYPTTKKGIHLFEGTREQHRQSNFKGLRTQREEKHLSVSSTFSTLALTNSPILKHHRN